MNVHRHGMEYHDQGSHNLRKFPQIYAVSMEVVLVIMRMHSFQKFIVASFLTTPPSNYRNVDMEISCESTDHDLSATL